jgi:DNA processing protein
LESEILYPIALTLIPGVGSITAKQLIAYCGSAEAVFNATPKELLRIPNIGAVLSSSIATAKTLDSAKEELDFMEKNGVEALFYLNKNYPERLRSCEDSPVILYKKGKADLSAQKVVSIVGTRHATAYGKQQCEKLVAGFSELGYNVLVISGLAFGIDVCAHRASLKNKLPTAGVLAHGLEMIYPPQHSSTAAEMVEQGGALLSDFASQSAMAPGNFVRRNRIVAGLADATIVVESAAEGGALITANMAFDYSRDVMALPGRVGDKFSEGCHKLIKMNKAALIETAADVAYNLGWDVPKKTAVQRQLFPADLSETEKMLLEFLAKNSEAQSIDNICRGTKLSMPTASSSLLNLEFSGLVKALPGKMFIRM